MVVSEERMAELEARHGAPRGADARGCDAGRARRHAAAALRPAPRPAARRSRARGRTPSRGERRGAPRRPGASRRRRARRGAAPRQRGLPRPAERERARVEDLLGGRVLGWVGGLAVLVGLVFLLVIAESRGWIGEEARCCWRRRPRSPCSAPARGCTSGAGAPRPRSRPQPPASPGCSRRSSSPARCTTCCPTCRFWHSRSAPARRRPRSRCAGRRPGSAGSASPARCSPLRSSARRRTAAASR